MINGRKIGYMPTGSFENNSVYEVCQCLKQIGYDAVEWNLSFASPETHSEKELENLTKVPQEFGMECSEIIVQQDMILLSEEKRKANLEFIKKCIRQYSQVGISVINLFTGPVPWEEKPVCIGKDISEGHAWELIWRAFDELVPYAEKYKINLAVENVWGMLCHDFYTAKYLIEHYKSPFLGVNYDPSHDVLAGHRDIGFIVEQWGPDVKHIHLKDAVGTQKAGEFIFPLLGEGDVDWNSFFSAVDRIGFSGVMSVEFESFKYVEQILGGNWKLAAENAYMHLEKLLA